MEGKMQIVDTGFRYYLIETFNTLCELNVSFIFLNMHFTFNYHDYTVSIEIEDKT